MDIIFKNFVEINAPVYEKGDLKISFDKKQDYRFLSADGNAHPCMAIRPKKMAMLI